MNSPVYYFLSLLCVSGFLLGIRLMNSPRTAVMGNMLGAVSMFGATLLTLISHGIIDHGLLWISIAIGGIIGYFMAIRISMIKMPQFVALLNGLGGGASAITAFIVLTNTMGRDSENALVSGLAMAVGGITFSGSMIAAGKLDRRIHQKPIVLPGHSLLNLITLLLIAFFIVLIQVCTGFQSAFVSMIIIACSLFSGILLTLRIGGADMPVTISLLNSLSGVAASIAGFAIGNHLLVAAGAIVGSAGLILTRIMCRAINRSLFEIIMGKTTVYHDTEKVIHADDLSNEIEVKAPVTVEEKMDTIAQALVYIREAKTVVIVPGYGMALSQAQEQVKMLFDKLIVQEKDVRFAIHPVAGRMPGHMNVLLAEVDIPYDKLFELEDMNKVFSETDAVIVVGANDVINSAANTAKNTPIYGMPVLNVGEAKHVIVCNMDAKPGYSGVDNPIYKQPGTLLLLGDAKETISNLIDNL